jgi:hypothetical protein
MVRVSVVAFCCLLAVVVSVLPAAADCRVGHCVDVDAHVTTEPLLSVPVQVIGGDVQATPFDVLGRAAALLCPPIGAGTVKSTCPFNLSLCAPPVQRSREGAWFVFHHWDNQPVGMDTVEYILWESTDLVAHYEPLSHFLPEGSELRALRVLTAYPNPGCQADLSATMEVDRPDWWFHMTSQPVGLRREADFLYVQSGSEAPVVVVTAPLAIGGDAGLPVLQFDHWTGRPRGQNTVRVKLRSEETQLTAVYKRLAPWTLRSGTARPPGARCESPAPGR